MPARWSLSYPDADFTAASVTMTQGATTIPCTHHLLRQRHQQRRLVHRRQHPRVGAGQSAHLAQRRYHLHRHGFKYPQHPGFTTFTKTYNVTLFDPNVLGQSVAITGSSTPPTIGSSYSFSSIAEADAYDLQVSTASTAAWNEGAEGLAPHRR